MRTTLTRSLTSLVTRFAGSSSSSPHHHFVLTAGAQQVLARHVACGAAAAAMVQPLAGVGGSLAVMSVPIQLGLAARFLSSAAAAAGSGAGQQQQQQQQPKKQPPPQNGDGGRPAAAAAATAAAKGKAAAAGAAAGEQAEEEVYDSLELTDERARAITDKIPQKPVTFVEASSYSVVILGAFAVLAFFVYNFLTNFILEPTYQTCFNATLARLKVDPRITVRLGNDVVGYGQESASRVQRQQIPHQLYTDAAGTEHVRLQFNMRGPGGVAVVNADMYKDPSTGHWDYMYLIADVKSGSSPPQRLNIVAPRLAPAPAA